MNIVVAAQRPFPVRGCIRPLIRVLAVTLGEGFVDVNTRMMWRKTANGRVEYPEYPDAAVEEGIVNGLIHRDYLKTDTVTKNIDDTISKKHSSTVVENTKKSLTTDRNHCVVPNVGNGTDSNPISKTISKEAWEILKVLSECRHVSAEQIGRMLGLSPSGVRYHIRALTSKSLIRRVGSSKTGHWEVVK